MSWVTTLPSAAIWLRPRGIRAGARAPEKTGHVETLGRGRAIDLVIEARQEIRSHRDRDHVRRVMRA